MAQLPIKIVATFKCSECGNEFETTLTSMHKEEHKSGTTSLEIIFYHKEKFCFDCLDKM